jgi:hypothetical protein
LSGACDEVDLDVGCQGRENVEEEEEEAKEAEDAKADVGWYTSDDATAVVLMVDGWNSGVALVDMSLDVAEAAEVDAASVELRLTATSCLARIGMACAACLCGRVSPSARSEKR